jgi:hypothetical protein
VVAAVLVEARPAARAGGNNGVEQRVSALEAKTRGMSATAATFDGCPEVMFTGVNVRIVNGTGSTETKNGCGNLIVGYNELRDQRDNDRTGSHNIVVGARDNFSSFGGLVVGDSNSISGHYASVTGGLLNKAIGLSSTVAGGSNNIASNAFASISGGQFNTASGFYSSVSGGAGNRAIGEGSSVSGGGGTVEGFLLGNAAFGDFSSVSGGVGCEAGGRHSSVSGGGVVNENLDFGWAAGSLQLLNPISGNFSSP